MAQVSRSRQGLWQCLGVCPPRESSWGGGGVTTRERGTTRRTCGAGLRRRSMPQRGARSTPPLPHGQGQVHIVGL